jgi:hypothetical protein
LAGTRRRRGCNEAVGDDDDDGGGGGGDGRPWWGWTESRVDDALRPDDDGDEDEGVYGGRGDMARVGRSRGGASD